MVFITWDLVYLIRYRGGLSRGGIGFGCIVED